MSDLGYHAPRFHRAFDVEEQIRLLPSNAACKGLFFNDPIARLRAVAPDHPLLSSSEIAGRRYVAFFDYPYSDFMRLLVAVAQALHPDRPLGEGLRRLGRTGYEALLQSQVGKVLFGIFGKSFGDVVRMGARGYRVSLSFGEVHVEELAERHVRYHFRKMPALIETYQVGIVEGGMNVCGVTGEITVQMKDLATGTLDIVWRDPR